MSINPSRLRWLLAGQQLLREGGIRAVKLDALCEAAGLTTGSFYHHFPNMAAFRRALASFWGIDQVQGLLAGVNDSDPKARLRRLTSLAQEESMVPLDAAMRDWAGSDPLAADAVRATDRALLEFMIEAFVELGHRTDEARLRAALLLSSGVARVDPSSWPRRSSARVVELLARLD